MHFRRFSKKRSKGILRVVAFPLPSREYIRSTYTVYTTYSFIYRLAIHTSKCSSFSVLTPFKSEKDISTSVSETPHTRQLRRCAATYLLNPENQQLWMKISCPIRHRREAGKQIVLLCRTPPACTASNECSTKSSEKAHRQNESTM